MASLSVFLMAYKANKHNTTNGVFKFFGKNVNQHFRSTEEQDINYCTWL